MLVLDRDRRIIAANAAMIELLGYPRERMLGHRIDMFLEPDEWQSLDSKWRAFERRGTLDGERSFSCADGCSVAIQYAARWVRAEGRDVALWVALHAELEPLRLSAGELPPGDVLTPRELEVVSLVAMGHRAHEIADELGIAPSTVRSHVRNAMRKSGTRSQAQLVALVCTGRMPRAGIMS